MEITQTLKDAAYIGIGVGVITARTANEATTELATTAKARVEQLSEWVKGIDLPELSLGERSLSDLNLREIKLPELKLGELKLIDGDASETIAKGRTYVSGRVADGVKVIDLRVDELNERLAPVLDVVAERLPDPARDAFGSARSAARDARTRVVSRLSA